MENRPPAQADGRMFAFLDRVLRRYRLPTVFISYRRADSFMYAKAIHRRLQAELGASNVFFDIEEIDLGADFARVIERRVTSCQVILVVIGPDWLNPRVESGERQRRLEDPHDYVRHEIEAGLGRGEDACRVIPILVAGAQMPKPHELPSTISQLCERNALKIEESLLDESIEKLVQNVLNIQVKAPDLRHTERVRRSVVPFIVSAVLTSLAAAWVNLADSIGMDARFTSVITRLADSAAPHAPSDRLALISIGEKSIEALNKPFDRTWRREHAALIRSLAHHGASALAFDLIIDEPSAFDDELRSALAEARKAGMTVIFGSDLGPEANSALRAAGADLGLLCLGRPKAFGYVIYSPLAVERSIQGHSPYLSSISLLAFVTGAEIKQIDFEDNRIQVEDRAGRQRTVRFSSSEREASGDRRACAALSDDDKIAKAMIRLSALEVLRDSAKRQEYADVFDLSPDRIAERYAGKIVLVGREDAADRDRVAFGLQVEQRYGFEIHADVLHTLIDGIHLRPLGFATQFIVALALAYQGQRIIFSPLLHRRPIRWAYLVAIVIGYLAIGAWLCAEFGILLDMYPLLALFLAYALVVHRARRLMLWDTRRR